MKIKFLIVVALFLITLSTQAQSQGCAHCNMEINDHRFEAFASEEGKSLRFDAIECLVNYNKAHTLDNMWIVDYNTKLKVKAEDAFYLKSKRLPSPMGAFISGFETEAGATAMKAKKSGEVMTWNTLVERFVDSNFGVEDIHKYHKARPDMYGPAGIMGDHLHAKGGKMIGIRYMNMAMSGNLSGTESISDAEVFNMYMVSPNSMNMQMMMVSAMYAPSNWLTLAAMQNYSINTMNLNTAKMNFSSKTTGISDLMVNALVGVISRARSSLHVNTGISFPIGSVTKRGNTPMAEDSKLPYAMQLGTGTCDATLGITYRKSAEKMSFGGQQLNTLRLGDNSQGYNFGNFYTANVWTAYNFRRNLSASIRVNASKHEAISGKDTELMPMMATTTMPSNYERSYIRSFIGVNAYLVDEMLLFSAEFGVPIYQNNMGVFMEETGVFNTGVKIIL